MAIIPKLVCDIRSNTAAALTFQPAAGKLWWFKALRFNHNVNLGSGADYVYIQRSDGSTHRSEVKLTTNEAPSTSSVHVDSTDGHPSVGEIPFPDATNHNGANSGGLWFTNANYLRVIASQANASIWWELAWFGIEADI